MSSTGDSDGLVVSMEEGVGLAVSIIETPKGSASTIYIPFAGSCSAAE
jgi:hypothetical protein